MVINNNHANRINEYKQTQLKIVNCNNNIPSYVSNYTTKIYLNHKKIILPNSVKCICYNHFYEQISSVYPNSIKYILNDSHEFKYCYDQAFDDYYVHNNVNKNINYSKNIICIKKNIRTKFTYNNVSNIFVQNLYVKNSIYNKNIYEKNIFLLEHITTVILDIVNQHHSIKNTYSLKNIKQLKLVNTMCLQNVFLFKNIKILHVLHTQYIENDYIHNICALNVCCVYICLYDEYGYMKICCPNDKYFKNIKTIVFYKEKKGVRNRIYLDSKYIKNIQNITVIGNVYLANIHMLKNAHVLITLLYIKCDSNDKFMLDYFNMMANFKCNFMKFHKHEIFNNTNFIENSLKQYC